MKVITAIAAATLFLGVTAASAQTPSSSASKPGATVGTSKDVSAADQLSEGETCKVDKQVEKSMTHRSTTGSGSSTTGSGSSTTGSGSSEPTGVTPGSNPNPSWNRNPDPEVPGNTME